MADHVAMAKYSAGLVGLGNIAWRFDQPPNGALPPRTHYEALVRDPRITIVAGCSPDEGDRCDFTAAHGLRACGDLGALLDLKPEIVSICSPSACHYEQVRQCLEHSVPMIWLEKPPTMTLAELDDLLAYRTEHAPRSRVVVNYMRRYSERYARFAEVFRREFLGKPLGLQISFTRGLETNASHFLDVMFWMFGDQCEVAVDVPSGMRERENPSFSLTLGSEFPVHVCGFDADYNTGDMVLTAEEGRVAILSGGLETRVEARAANEHYAGFSHLKPHGDDMLGREGVEDLFGPALSDLIDCFEKQREPRSSLRTSRGAQSVIEQVRRG